MLARRQVLPNEALPGFCDDLAVKNTDARRDANDVVAVTALGTWGTSSCVLRMRLSVAVKPYKKVPILAELLPQIETPVQIIGGLWDWAVPPSNHRYLRAPPA
jgi:hypothetical protein